MYYLDNKIKRPKQKLKHGYQKFGVKRNLAIIASMTRFSSIIGTLRFSFRILLIERKQF